jgi:outer membrane receptor for monomeric catechols
LALTWLQAEYDSDIITENVLVARQGNTIEFVPEWSVSATLGVAGFGPREAFGVSVTATYIGEQYSDGLNTEAVDASGSVGLIDDVLLFDATARYQPLGRRYEFYVGVQNLLDEEFVAYRRGGQGTVAGAPLKGVAGFAAGF